MGLESSLSRQIVRALYEQRAERHPDAWIASRCEECGRVRPFEVQSCTYHTRVLFSRSEKFRATLICNFCGQKQTLPWEQRVAADKQWTPKRPIAELVASTAPTIAYKKEPETDESLVRLFNSLQRSPTRWKGDMVLGWESWVVGILAALATAGVVHVTNLGALWQFEDESGSPLIIILPVIVGVISMCLMARRRTSAKVRDQLAERMQTYDLDASRLRRLAVDAGNRYAGIVLALDEIQRGSANNRGRAPRG